MFRVFLDQIDPFQRYESKSRPARDLWGFFREHSKPFHRLFVVAGCLAICVAAIEIGLIALMGWLVDALQREPEGFLNAHWGTLLLLGAAILTVRPVVQSLHGLVLQIAIMPNFATLVRWRAHRHVLGQSMSWYENDFAGRISNRVMQAPSAASEAVFQVFDAFSFALAYVLGAAILLATADPALVTPLILWFAGYAWFMTWVLKRIRPAAAAVSGTRSELTGRLVDAYTNIQSVKLFAHHTRELTYGKEAMVDNREKFFAEMRIYVLMDIGINLLNGVLIVGVVGWAIWLWSGDAASVGLVVAATAMALRINSMSGWIMWALTNFFQQMGIVEEGLETITAPIGLNDAPGAKALLVSKGAISVQGVSHHYGAKQGGLEGVSLEIKPGEKIGLVGRSGAGKSTLVKLLLRFYDAEAGKIAIDGQNIREVDQESLRRALGMVPQESALMHRSVRDNILYGCPDASDEAMILAAKRAQAHDFILGLQDAQGGGGYDARVGERGVKLSGGQRQRIALARVILKDAPILLLDEATSALDSEVEAAIQDTLYDMMEGKTVLAIAHRLSTIARMDRIIVIDAGRVIEEGSHEALLERAGVYAQLWHRQSGGFLDVEAVV